MLKQAATFMLAPALLAACLSARAADFREESSVELADEILPQGPQPPAEVSPPDPRAAAERNVTGLSLIIDEHVFANPFHDQDYTGGGEITFSGARAGGRFPVDLLLGLIDRVVGLPTPDKARPAHALAIGLLVFAPPDLAQHEPVRGDRPYASLLFLSSGRRYVLTDRPVAYDSSLTLGMLGLSAAESVQRALHHLTHSTQPEGWAHQISAGGEPTARYSLARQSLLTQHLVSSGISYDAKWTLAGSVGTVTEGSLALNLRFGRIASPWWVFSPDQTMYVSETQPAPPPLAAHSGSELFALAGLRGKVRAYNAFMEGQFRHSDLRYSGSDLNALLGEAWAGFEFRTASGFEVRYLARWESPELRRGIGSRSLFWGSIQLAKTFGPP
jgi:hypothetical protein